MEFIDLDVRQDLIQFELKQCIEKVLTDGSPIVGPNNLPCDIYSFRSRGSYEHVLPDVQRLGYKEGDFPVSEDCSRRIVSLPMHPYLGAEEQKQIPKAIGHTITYL